ncbi:MAG TPA: Hint domain-containing protein [Candidatus Acidoferrum sp.]|nr:Hint domain-containing protein [Candidatus Acidoferrum sp.]
MLNIPQIEALRQSNPQLYEALKRLSDASLGPNQGWSLDDQVTDGTDYARVTAGALTAGNIDPTKSGVLMKGSVPPTWSGAFTYVSTTASITWSWSGLSICRADGSTTTVPNGSIAVSGLAAGSTYYFYPYWDEGANALAWVAGGTGSPANALTTKTNVAAQQQALQGRIPLSQGAIMAATTTSGTGGGSGGGSGSCLRAGTLVLTRERGTVGIETCKVGEHLRCPDAAGDGETWTRIVRHQVRSADTFIRLHFSNAESLDVTPHHIFTLADGSPVRADRLCLCDIFVGRFSFVTLKRIEAVNADSQKVSVTCEPTPEFFAGRYAASVLTHNYTFSS